MLNAYLREHAIDTVWCSPGIDTHFLLELSRLSGDGGVIDTIDLEWERYRLPESGEPFHVYMVGQIPLYMLGIKEIMIPEQWVFLDDLNNINKTVMNVYTGLGHEIGSGGCYLQVTKYKGVLLAIKFYRKENLLQVPSVYLRVYKNRFYESNAHIPGQEDIVYTTFSNRSDVALDNFLKKHRRYLDKEYGGAMLTYDGYWYNDVTTDHVDREDVMTSFFDGSIDFYVTINMKSIQSYQSRIDANTKYLLHLPKQINSIYYYRDSDFYLGVLEHDFFRGVRLHKNNDLSIRQITHNDYGIDALYVNSFHLTHFKEFPIDDLTILVKVRNSGKRKSLIHVTDRIMALYRMDDNLIVRALAGIDSTVDFWRAENLEKAYYPALMASPLSDITPAMVSRCYGYCGTAKVLAQSPLMVDPPGGNAVPMPPLLQKATLVSEYTTSGSLIEHYQVYNRNTYIAQNNDIGWIEALAGEATERVYQGYGKDVCHIRKGIRYKGYTAKRYAGGTLGTWVDRTSDGVYHIENDTLVWDIDDKEYLRVVIGDDRIFWSDTIIDYSNGNLRHQLKVDISEEVGNTHYIDMTLPLGIYRVFINNKSLIEGLDYYIDKTWINIVNKDYLPAGRKKTRLTIIGYGFCTEDIKTIPPYETGHVKWGRLYFNDRYDYRDEWMDRYIVHGNLYPREVLIFAEDGGCFLSSESGDEIPLPNGMPYMVGAHRPPLPTTLDMDYDSELSLAIKKSKAISDYLSDTLPVIPPDTPFFIKRRYTLFSPFMSLSSTDLSEGRWILPDGEISDSKLDQLIEGYKWLLEFDPCVIGYNKDYIAVHPHTFSIVIKVTRREYQILERMNSIYLNGCVDLTPHIGISDEVSS